MSHYDNRINFTPGSMNHTVWLGVFLNHNDLYKTHTLMNKRMVPFLTAGVTKWLRAETTAENTGSCRFWSQWVYEKDFDEVIFNFRSKTIQLSVQTNPCTQQMPKFCSNCSNQLILIYLANFFMKNLTKLHTTHQHAKIRCQAKMVKNAPIT